MTGPMHPKPLKVSVLMPVYNERNTVRHAVERVRSVGMNAEIICVDDCSTDGTRSVLQSLLEAGHIDALVLHEVVVRHLLDPKGRLSKFVGGRLPLIRREVGPSGDPAGSQHRLWALQEGPRLLIETSSGDSLPAELSP